MGDLIGVVLLFAFAAGIMYIVDLFRKDSLEKEKRAKKEAEAAAALQLQQENNMLQDRISAFQEEYGAAVSYYYNNALVDSNGIYIPTDILGTTIKRKYFTLAELDDIKDRYEKRMRNR